MDNKTFRKQINASGFPFQNRVEHEVMTSTDQHKWLPITQEYHWVNPAAGTEGFIDLILRKQSPDDPFVLWYIVIECKRVIGGNWVFLSSQDHQKESNGYVLLTKRQYNIQRQPKWTICPIMPHSPLSSFCTVPGQGDKDTPMLERISGNLLDSVESLATDELDIGQKLSGDFPEIISFYIPLIVTNTELITCQYGPGEINLSEGILKDNSGKFQGVPYIRFQKSFTTRYTTDKIPMSLKEANKEKERTIFVVHAPMLIDFLQTLGT